MAGDGLLQSKRRVGFGTEEDNVKICPYPAYLDLHGQQAPGECLGELGDRDKVMSGVRKFGSEDLCDPLEMAGLGGCLGVLLKDWG